MIRPGIGIGHGAGVALRMLTGTRFALLIAVALAPAVAAAADLPPQAPPPTAPATYAPPAPDWIVTIGIEPRAVPSWPGAADSRFGLTVFPLFNVRKAGTPPEFSGGRDSFGFDLVDLGVFKFGPAFKYVSQVDPQDYNQLKGQAGVHAALQAGVFAEIWPVTWLRLRGELLQGIGGETGLTGNAFLDAVIPFGQFRWSAGPRVTYQSSKAVDPYFSVTPAESGSSTIAGFPMMPAYSASGGLYSYGAGTQLEYFANDQWAVHGIVEYERLTGSVADSPLVTQRGSPNQWIFGVGATYAFSMRPWW
jgi:outer membrane scaffolding protein for murein synthesis (MipA/OmpV family)